MSYYFALPLILALFPSGINARGAVVDRQKCFDENHNEIDCPHKSDTQKIIAIAVPVGIVALLLAGLVIYCFLKKRRARRSLADNADASAAPYDISAPQVEQGQAGQWALPPQYNPNPFLEGQPYAPPPGPPPGPPSDLAHGGGYNGGEPEKHSY